VTFDNRKYIPVEGHPDLVRDSSSGAILNIKATPPGTAAKARRAKDKKFDELKDEVDVLKSDLSEIKSLLKSFLETNNDR
jgi:hypothetical protein